MNIRQVDAFRAVVEGGSMTAAATRLAVSQPNVSRLIADLENAVGFRLFERAAGRRIVPTADGLTFYAEVERTMAGLDHLRDVAFEIKNTGNGRIRIAAIPAIADTLLATAISQFNSEHPDVKVTIQQVSSAAIPALVASNHIDFGLVGTCRRSGGFKLYRLYRVRGLCVLPANHRLAGRSLLSPTDFDGESFISYSATDLTRQTIDQIFEAAGVHRAMTLETQHTATICALVAGGAGVSIVNAICVEMLRALPCVFLPFSHEVLFHGNILISDSRPPTRLVSRLFDLTRAAADAQDRSMRAGALSGPE